MSNLVPEHALSASASLRVAVAGAGGMVGGELLRLLLQHPRVGDVVALSRSQIGKNVHDVHPALRHLRPVPFSDESVEQAAQRVDVFFCALGHGESQKVMPAILGAEARVIDLAADFRLKDADEYVHAYGPHACFDLRPRFVYGLPELCRDQVVASRAVANPGCFATAAELLLLPLARAGLLPEHTAIFGVTGSSGSGAMPKAATHHPFRDGNLYAYKLMTHQHEPEIRQLLAEASGKPVSLRLLTHSGPFVRGIHVTTYLHNPAFRDVDVNGLYHNAYSPGRTPFVEVLKAPPALAEIVGSNYVHVHTAQKGEEVAVTLVLDNLVKGAAGQAIQNMNLVCGFDERDGLTHPGAYPC